MFYWREVAVYLDYEQEAEFSSCCLDLLINFMSSLNAFHCFYHCMKWPPGRHCSCLLMNDSAFVFIAGQLSLILKLPHYSVSLVCVFILCLTSYNVVFDTFRLNGINFYCHTHLYSTIKWHFVPAFKPSYLGALRAAAESRRTATAKLMRCCMFRDDFWPQRCK